MYEQLYNIHGQPSDSHLGWVHINVNTSDGIIDNFVTELNVNRGGKRIK